MKRTLLIAGVLGMLVAGGCQKLQSMTETTNFRISSLGNNNYYFRYKKRVAHGDEVEAFNRVIYKVSSFGRSKGYQYLALTNEKANNISGFPLNTLSSMDKYLKLSGVAHYKPVVYGHGGIVNRGSVIAKVHYFKKKPMGIFAWNLNSL